MIKLSLGDSRLTRGLSSSKEPDDRRQNRIQRVKAESLPDLETIHGKRGRYTLVDSLMEPHGVENQGLLRGKPRLNRWFTGFRGWADCKSENEPNRNTISTTRYKFFIVEKTPSQPCDTKRPIYRICQHNLTHKTLEKISTHRC